MKVATIIPLGAFVAGAVAQASNAFETADFNVAKALLDNGFNVSAVPELTSLLKQSSRNACSVACTSLTVIYGNAKVLFEGTSDYDAWTGRYWSALQGGVNPRCVFKPAKASEVSALVLLSRLTQCPFAVKGGGHAAFAGASSIEGGITVSLENINQISVSSNKKTVDIGPGNRWVNVYSALESYGLGVVGGRMAPVGVPGLILGGGISFFSNKFGWACDNVASYEVVTASGIIVTASPTSFSDLYWALRGGGNNFGIVTNFKLNAFPLGKMWGGQRIYTEDTFAPVLDAIYEFGATGSSKDEDAAQIVSFTSLPGFGRIVIAQLDYALPVSNATIFEDWNAIPHAQSTTDIHTLAELTIMMNEGQVDGLRQTYWDVSFKLDRELFTFLVSTFYSLYSTVADVAGLFPVISIQPITQGQLKGMQKNGGNALGLDASKGPYFIMNLGASWTNTADDTRVWNFMSTVIETVKVEARKKGVDNSFIYMNYASQFQDPITSYGSANQKRLQAISAKYDPRRVFQDLQPGYFKLAKGPPKLAIAKLV